MYRLSFLPSDAVTFALSFMIAYKRADDRQRIVLEQDLSGLHHLVLFEQANDLRDICLNRASLHTAERLLALETTVGFI